MVSGLRPGIYNLRVTAPSFLPAVRERVDLRLGIASVVNLTLSTSSGYLSDPYKAFRFDAYPVPESLFPERRPGHKTRQVGYIGYTHSIPQLNGSADGSYRIAHDSYGILSQKHREG